MKSTTLIVVLLALPATKAPEKAKRLQKRSVFDRDLALGGHDFGEHEFSEQSFGGHDFLQNAGSNYDGHDFGGSELDAHHGSIDLSPQVHIHIIITKKFGVPVPKPYLVTVEKKYPVRVLHSVGVPVDKPYPVHVPEPFPVSVEKAVAYIVYKNVLYPMKFPVKVPAKVSHLLLN